MPTLTVQELDDVKRYVLRELPRALEQDPEFAIFIEGLLSEKFPRRDEFARLLNEVQSTNSRLADFQDETRQNFDQVRTDLRQEIGQVRTDLSQEIGQARTDLSQEIGQVRTDLSQEIGQVRTDLSQEIGQVRTDLQYLTNLVNSVLGGLQTRAGRNFENAIAGVLKYGLARPDIDPNNVKLRQMISDPTGLVFRPGQTREVDIVAQDGEIIVLEVKSNAKVDDVRYFADKVELVRLQNTDKRVSGVMITLGAADDVRATCQKHGLQLIP